jgi:hypothetical protein
VFGGLDVEFHNVEGAAGSANFCHDLHKMLSKFAKSALIKMPVYASLKQ